MIKTVLSLIGAIVFSSQVWATDFIVEPLDYDFPAEISAAAEDGKNVVVMFEQNGCPYCEKMHKRVFPHPDVTALYNEKFILIQINNKGDLDVTTPAGEVMAEKDFSAKTQVRATPVFMFYGKDGAEALRLTGYQDPGMFIAAGTYVAEEVYADGTTFLNYVRSLK